MKFRNFPNSFTASFEFSHPISKVWPLVTDTDRLNQAAGNPEVKYTYEKNPAGGTVRFGQFRVNGVLMRWLEHPYEWEFERRFCSQRDYECGPLKHMDTQGVFEPLPGGGCRVKMIVTWMPRNTLLGPAIKIQFKLIRRSFLRAFSQIQKFLDKKDEKPFRVPESPFRPDEQTVQFVNERLAAAEVDPEISKKLTKFVFESYESDLVRIRPFKLARLWNADKLKVLTAFLRLAERGVFSLSWDLICPGCRGAKQKFRGLKELSNTAHCDTCDIKFDASFDRSVELSFNVNPSVRKISVGEFCVGGPQNTPHLIAQRRLSPGETAAIEVPLAEGFYRVMSRQANQIIPVECEKMNVAREPVKFVFDGEGRPQHPLHLAAGKVTASLENRTNHEITAVVEKTAWADDACTAAYVTTQQEFRKRFSSEVLAPGQEVALSAVALLFTDLKGSTALYHRVGDAQAFRLVQNHFEVLVDCVTKHEGTLVKTIGDAVMAAFLKPENAVAAAIEMHERIQEAYKSEENKLRIKVGIHYGPCYVVTMNERLDYFGETVNIAARTEGQCEGGDIVISEVVMKEKAVNSLVTKKGLQPRPFEASLKGFDNSFNLYRINPFVQALDLTPIQGHGKIS